MDILWLVDLIGMVNVWSHEKESKLRFGKLHNDEV